MTRLAAARVVSVELGAEAAPLRLDRRHGHALLVVRRAGRVVGEVQVAPGPGGLVPVEAQRAAVLERLAPVLGRELLYERAERALSAPSGDGARPAPGASVVVCTSGRPRDLDACLAGLAALRTAPREVIVVDNRPGDPGTREACERHGVRYLAEPEPGASRARNRGVAAATAELVAFTDDDCVVDPRWLDGLAEAFDDPLVMASCGYIGPLELEEPAQVLFEAHGGFQRHPQWRLFESVAASPTIMAGQAGATANAVVRRAAFAAVGGFAEDLGPGTAVPASEDKELFARILAAGWRIVFDPGQVVWHRHRRDRAGLRRVLSAYATGEVAVGVRNLRRWRDLGVLGAWAWWARHVAEEWRRILRRAPDRMPLAIVAGETAGLARGARRALTAGAAAPVPRPPLAAAPAPRVEIGAEAPTLTVAVPSYNRREALRTTLAGLAAQGFPADRLEVVVVVDGSTDGTAGMARALETPFRLRVLEQENRGVGACRNRGAREASEDVVVFLDDDIEPAPGFLAAHADAHARPGPAHFVLGYYPPARVDGSLWSLVLRAWWEDHFRRKARPGHQWTYMDFVDGNCSFPPPLLATHGGYDESFRGRRQDWELAVRLMDGGARFAYEPAAMGLHRLDVSFDTAVRNSRQEGRWDVALGRKHPQVAGHLLLDHLAGRPQEPGRPGASAWRRLLARRLAGGGAVALATPAVHLLDRLRARASWHRLAHAVLWRAYVDGVRDVLDTPERWNAFFGPMAEGARPELTLALDAPEPVRAPVAAGGELAVSWRGRPVTRLRAPDVGNQWDSRALAGRVAAAVDDALAREALDEALRAGDAGAPWLAG